jgi:hypothetical protein
VQEINALALPAYSSANTFSAFSLTVSSSGSEAGSETSTTNTHYNHYYNQSTTAASSTSSNTSPQAVPEPLTPSSPKARKGGTLGREKGRKRVASVHSGVPLPESGSLLDCFTKGRLIGNGMGRVHLFFICFYCSLFQIIIFCDFYVVMLFYVALLLLFFLCSR